jgi:cell division protease FtsH
MATMAVLMGGRTAEELVYNEMTTGASDDIERATNIARRMVTEFGMSEALGPIKFGQAQHEVFLGRDYGHEANYSDSVAASIDAEIRELVDTAHAEAEAILRAHRSVLDELADRLVDKETLGPDDLAELLGGLPAWTGVGGASDLVAAAVANPVEPAGAPGAAGAGSGSEDGSDEGSPSGRRAVRKRVARPAAPAKPKPATA